MVVGLDVEQALRVLPVDGDDGVGVEDSLGAGVLVQDLSVGGLFEPVLGEDAVDLVILVPVKDVISGNWVGARGGRDRVLGLHPERHVGSVERAEF